MPRIRQNLGARLGLSDAAADQLMRLNPARALRMG
jgi:hypothetical protein